MSHKPESIQNKLSWLENGDGTYPWSRKCHGKKLLNQKWAKNYKQRKIDKGVRMSNSQKKVNGKQDQRSIASPKSNV